jgi:two-component sensor histidine kinase
MHSTQDARLMELMADNARLRRLLNQKHVSSELRHQLRNTLSMLRVIIRQSAETSEDLHVYVARLEDRLDAILAAQNAANSAGETILHNIIAS